MQKKGESHGRGPAPALLVRHVEKIAASLPPNRFGIRDLSLMTLHFAIAGREHELAYPGEDADPDSFAFRTVHNRWKTVLVDGLDPVTIGDILTRIGARAGLDIRPAGHSPRRGLVTESSRAGNPDAVAERQGGWAPGSKVMRRYREADEGVKENALHGVL